MFFIGATDQRLAVVNDAGVEIYHADLRHLVSVITNLRGHIRVVCIASPTGQIDQDMLAVLEDQLKLDPAFQFLKTMPFSPGLDARLLALAALVASAVDGGSGGKKGHNHDKKHKKGKR